MKQKHFRTRAILFDMDGVITDTMPYHFRAWRKIFGNLGIKINYYDIYKREGQKGIESVKEIFNEKGREFILKEAKEILAEKEKLFKSIVKVRFINGSKSFLNFVKKKGLKLGLVTGTSDHELKKILPIHIYAKFDAVITATDVQKGKPNPEPYLKCLKRLRISPSEAVVIENAPFGITSAKESGIFCIAISTHLPPKFLKEADLIVHSFKELKQNHLFLPRR